MIRQDWDYKNTMDYIAEQGLAQGMEEGMEKGMEKGMTEEQVRVLAAGTDPGK